MNRAFEDDELPGFEKLTLPLPAEDDGELAATLIRRKTDGQETRAESPRPSSKGGVLYLHGLVDYFFQEHLAEAVEAAGFTFYALDLRRYGRSLRPGNLPNFAREIDDYFPEITRSLEIMADAGHPAQSLIAHSTGCLSAAHYCQRGSRGAEIKQLILNSPFLDFRVSAFEKLQLNAVRPLGRLFPQWRIPASPGSSYGQSIHSSFHGEWDYDLKKKPVGAFPLYAGWFRMILEAQAAVRRGLGLKQDCLLLHSARSRRGSVPPQAEDFESDTILNVEHMKALGPHLGERLTLTGIEGGLHDLTLSRKPARDLTLKTMTAFLTKEEL